LAASSIGSQVSIGHFIASIATPRREHAIVELMLIDRVSDLGRDAIEADWRSYLDRRWRTTSGHYNRADTRALHSGRSHEREGLREIPSDEEATKCR
jgi:hypothetical protein